MNVRAFLHPPGWLGRTPGPRYVQLRRRLEEGIESGLLAPGSSLPSEREIAELTNLSRVTVRRAIQTLVEMGRVDPRQGSGSFVRARPRRVEQSLAHLTSFSDDMHRRGMETASKWLTRGVFMPSPQEIISLGLSPGTSVTRLHRLRTADARPLAVERAALPPDILPDPMDVTTSLYAVLEQTGFRPVRAIQKISAINLDAEDAALLDVAERSAGLTIQRTSYLQSGRVAEFTQSTYRGDAYDFVAELRLSG